MQEPAYILKNGQSVPYVPATITTNREAYAASLHVLFKHVADFHICVVRVFSAKYGIPEDDILKTIQESDEFKDMHVDPVLDTDSMVSLGYLAEVPVTKEEVPDSKSEEVPAPAPAQKAKPTKVKKTKNTEPEPEPEQVVVVAPTVSAEESRPMEERESDPSVIKTKTIRKKIVAPKAIDPTPTTATIVVADDPGVVTKSESEPIKTIRKKIVQKPAQPIAEPTQPIAEPVKAASSVPTTAPATKAAPATTAPATTAPATTAPDTTTADAPRKIIKKKAKPAA
jgi:hypothetical protein